MRRPALLPDSFRDLNPYLVGLVSVGAIGAVVGFAFLVGLLHLFEDTYEVRAVFSDSGGLRGGDDVKVAGVKAGRVTDLDIDREKGHVVVTMAVDDDVDLGPATTAEIALETLLGTKYVDLDGPVAEPYLASQPEEQRTIPLERTATPFDIFELTRVGTETIEATDNERLNAFIKDLAEITEGKQESLGRLVRGIDEVSAAVNARDQRLRSLLDHADTLTATLAEKDRTLVSLIDQSQAILRVLSDRRHDLQAGLRAGEAATGELARLLVDNQATIDALLADLQPTLEVLSRRQAELNATLAYTGPAQLLQSRAGSHGPWTDIYVRSLGPDVVAVLEEAFGTDPEARG